jgi:hypothetical protein
MDFGWPETNSTVAQVNIHSIWERSKMARRFPKFAFVLILMITLSIAQPGSPALAASMHPDASQPQLTSSMGVSLHESTGWQPTPVPLMYDPNAIPIRVEPLRPAGLSPQSATFTFDYVPAGSKSALNDICLTYPEAAKAALNDAGAKWGALLNSPVPIRIEVCWANMDQGILGHSSALSYERDFAGAPKANTYYQVALANALHGSDLTSTDDISITYANGYLSSFYFGTDGNSQGKIDFESVVMHEMGHGLGFAGSLRADNSSGTWLGYRAFSYPFIYDLSAIDFSGNSLINTIIYPNNSTALYSALTSGNLFLNGANAVAANGGVRVPLYSPFYYQGGSTYSHLAESYNGTPNAMMTYSAGNDEVLHDPGPVVMGFLKDEGWITSPVIPAAPTNLNVVAVSAGQINLTWTDNSTNETLFNVQRAGSDLNWAPIGTAAWVMNQGGTGTYINTGLSEVTQYNYRVCAYNGSACSGFSNMATATTLPAVTNLTAVGTSLNQIHVSWVDQSAHETSFKIARSVNGSTGWVNLSDVAAAPGTGATVGFDDTGMTEGTSYFYSVCAMGTSACSTAAVVQGASMLNAPTLISTSVVNWHRIDVSWTDNSTKETGYEIQVSSNGVNGWSTIGTYTAGAGATTGARTYQSPAGFSTTIYFRVRAITPLTNSTWLTGTGVTPIQAPIHTYSPTIAK